MSIKHKSIDVRDAVNNPTAEFQMRADNFRVGDNITVTGDHSVGKVR